jgi:ribonucleoside-diphosphate reductase alpha chain
MNTTPGPQTPFSQQLHAEKYRAAGESFHEGMNRVAGALTQGRESFLVLRDILEDMRFMPGGRIQAAVGSPKRVTPYNCFVSGTIMDSFIEGNGSIMNRATESAATQRMGGGIGYGFSWLRPRGAPIKKLGSVSSGPIEFMGIFDAICKCIASSGHRRGAQMGVLRVDHPDIEEFIHCKQNSDKLTGFNISIGVTDEFMRAVRDDVDFDLRWGGEVYNTVSARSLWDKIMRSTWDWAEPGVLFIDRINTMNNLYYCEVIEATNPCGEQPLPPYGACLLGSFNLTKYITVDTSDESCQSATDSNGSGYWRFDYKQFAEDIPHVVRAMDKVVDIATYPLFEQEQEAKNKRRMGLGVTGLANAGETLGHPYGSEEFLVFEREVLSILRDESYRASAHLAAELGTFPLYDADKYQAGEFIQSLPLDIQDLIRKHGIRNSHLTSIAPTGTISLCADNCSSGIEPVFSKSVRRTVQTFDGPIQVLVEDYAFAQWGTEPVEANDVSAEEHLMVLATAQVYMDSAVSKTCNVPSDMAWSDFKDLYMRAWELGCKGITTFNAGGKRMGILKKEDPDVKALKEEMERMKNEIDEGLSCEIDPVTGRSNCE